MSLHTWWLFFIAVFLTCGTPGPNMLHIMTRAVDVGVRRSIFAMLGCLSAMVLVLIASAGGVTALVLAVPGLFDVIRYAGIAYLFYLGWKAWTAPVVEPDPMAVSVGKRTTLDISPRRVFATAFAIGISNPKLLLFATAFFPQFINPSSPKPPQFAILIVTFLLAEMFWYAIYAFGGQRISRALTRPTLQRAFNRMTGGIFVGFGIAMLRIRPN